MGSGGRSAAGLGGLRVGLRLLEVGARPFPLLLRGQSFFEQGVLAVEAALGDLDPRRDGWMLHPTVRLQDPRRESSDRMLVRLIAEHRMPVLGIGAGMQLINVSQGGNLMLHIPEDMPGALPHLDPLDPDHRHTLQLASGSIMDRVYGDGELRVNSMHHMAVDEIAPGFQVTARCPDGIVEAIESTMEDWFAFGTQFHPEASTASALDMQVFDAFLEGCKEQTQQQPATIPFPARRAA